MQSHQLHHQHHLQQQLAALLSAALPKSSSASSAGADGSDTTISSSSQAVPEASGERGDEAIRLSALDSLRRAVLYPPNALVLSQSAPYLSHGLSQILVDKSYAVRRSAAVIYASLCAILCSTPLGSNGAKNHVMTLGEHFVAWALPLLGDIGITSGSTELALEGLQQFLNIADAVSIDHVIPPIMKAFQELLEDERTSLSLLQQLLGVLTLTSLKFGHYFQLHFLDIIDLLLGWAFMPDLSESDRTIIMDSFLQFQKHWLNNLQFTLGLLSKFLGDIEVLVQDVSHDNGGSQFGRLLALFTCFSTVLQVTTSGMMEMNRLDEIREPLENITPQLIRCITVFGSKFGSSKWTRDSWRCLTQIAEILKERFSNFYPKIIDILFQSLIGIPSLQVHALMKTNLQLLSLQNLALLPSSVQIILGSFSPLSQLRLHPNHLVVAISAATYLFFVQHRSDVVVSQAVTSLIEELEMFKNMIQKIHGKYADLGEPTVEIRHNSVMSNLVFLGMFSEHELLSFIKFDLKILQSSVYISGIDEVISTLRYDRSTRILSFILEKFNPFDPSIDDYPELQAAILKTLHNLSEISFSSRFENIRTSWKTDSGNPSEKVQGCHEPTNSMVMDYLKRYSPCIIRSLKATPVNVKMESLDWIISFSRMVMTMFKDGEWIQSFSEPLEYAVIGSDLLVALLDAAYSKEPKVRSHVAAVLEVLLQGRLIDSVHFSYVSAVSLDKLGDPDGAVKSAFTRVLSLFLPSTIYLHGLVEDGEISSEFLPPSIISRKYLTWKNALAMKQSSRKLQSHHFVTIISYISHKWKGPLSSRIQRLIFSCHGKKEISSGKVELVEEFGSSSLWKGGKVEEPLLDDICQVNNIAALWWSIHEAARHCIVLRLRTNLGSPTQTFAAIERMLLDIPNVLMLDAEHGDGSHIALSSGHLLPMYLLLDFVESLKKNVYNAYEGSFVLPCSTRQSSLFFHANKKVCEEWFSRICEPMMNAGLALYCHDTTIQYCALRLQDLRTLVISTFKDKSRGATASESSNLKSRLAGDVIKVLQHASLAMCRNYESEALIGLQKWVATQFSVLFKEDKQIGTGITASFGQFSWMTGLVYQAQGQYEKAAAYYTYLLQSDVTLNLMDSDGVQFVIERVIECYTSISDWKSLEIWLGELQALRAMHAGKSYSGALTTAGNDLNAIHALACFDDGDFQAAWAYLDLTPKSSCEITLDPKVALERSEQMLLRSMLQKEGHTSEKIGEELEKANLMLDEMLSILSLDRLSKSASCSIQLLSLNAFEEGTKSSSQDPINGCPSFLCSLRQVLQSPISRFRQDSSSWIKLFRICRSLLPNSSVTQQLCQRLLTMARKQSNFMLAERMNKYLREHALTLQGGTDAQFLDLNLKYEDILLTYTKGKHEEALLNIWSLLRDTMLSTETISAGTTSFLKAKACLKFSTWLNQGFSYPNFKTVILRLFDDFVANVSCTSFTGPDISSGNDDLTSDSCCLKILQEIVGTARKLSCQLCPIMGKAWLSYASWCFDQAKGSLTGGTALQSCTLSPVLLTELSPDRFHLSEKEISEVKGIINKICNAEIYDIVTGSDYDQRGSIQLHDNVSILSLLVQKAIYIMEETAGAPGFESCDGECPSATLSSQLEVLFLHSGYGIRKADILSLVNELVGIWWSLRQRRVSLFGYAADGYFQYLSYSSKFPGYSNKYALKEKARPCNLKAMLYILHIIVNYGYELRERLEQGLGKVPLLPWQELIPQLFAHLSSHPKQAVRKILEGILMMLAKLCPWSVVYPTLVDLNAYEGHPSEELQRILGCLLKIYPRLVQDVQLVINELEMITVLWEELWLSTLQDLHSDVNRRINMLKEEAARIAENSTLSDTEKIKINAVKYSAMMAPVVVALERRLASTSREPRTAHEMWFHKEYNGLLKSAIFDFKTPPGSVTALGDVWRPFETIASSLATHHRKPCIPLLDVAPQLASLSSSDVPMPGFEKQLPRLDSIGSSTEIQGIVTISSFFEEVTILSTKTKPKKLVFQGSDGQNYVYLLKGREDLRLDARIMQLLQAINNMLYSCNDTRKQSLSIRHYSVTPISDRAGLIQWVNNVTSIYSIYKSWQIRAQLAQVSSVDAGNLKNQAPHVPRPSDMFYGKIIPALKEKGIRKVISRRDWPLEVKRKVFLELMKETPRQLLWQEIWCASEGFKAFSLKAKRFSGSVATMSIVGHILGLGDRHLDNILMDFRTGDIVHIDYNVCFDKGRRLKIPEIVPFRLTQIIEAALGLTGIEGTFRSNCEEVMRLLQKNKDAILMLLEVFVWDPLVEWTRGDNHDEAALAGEEKKGMELAVSLSLFSSRVQEIRVPLQEHHDLLVATLPAVEFALKAFLDTLNKFESTSSISYHADKERSNLLQREAAAKAVVAEVTSIAEKARATFEVQALEFAQAKAVMAEKAQEVVLWVDQHARVLDALRAGAIPDVKACLKLSDKKEAVSLISAVVVSGVPLSVVPEPTQAQCSELDREVSRASTELDSGISCAIEALHEYTMALQRILPLDYASTSPVSGWAQILELSAKSISPDVLLVARKQSSEFIAKSQGEGLDLICQRHQDLLQKMDKYVLGIEKLASECSELMSSIGSDTESKSKDNLLSSFANYMQSVGHSKNDKDMLTLSEQNRNNEIKDNLVHGDLEEKKLKVLSVLYLAVIELYREIESKMMNIFSKSTMKVGWRTGDNVSVDDSHFTFLEFQGQIERGSLIAAFVVEAQQVVETEFSISSTSVDNVKSKPDESWASAFQTSLLLSKHLIEEMTEVLPEIIRLAISYDSEVMEAFGSLSQLRGSIHTILEKLVEAEVERVSLAELERNYLVNVGRITEQQLALGEAAVKGRDDLSWEEAEELASQEEACRAELDQLHLTWNQKDMRSSSLSKLEANIKSSLVSSQKYLRSLLNIEEEGDLHRRKSKVLLASLAKPFSKLESIDHMLLSYDALLSNSDGLSCNLEVLLASSSSLSESVWEFSYLLKNHAFFVWKVSMMDSILQTCFHEISSSVDHNANLDFDQLCNSLRKKVANDLQKHIYCYLNERVARTFLVQLVKESENLQQIVEARSGFPSNQVNIDAGVVRRLRFMLDEYCNTHETAMAARSAVSLMKGQMIELTKALGKTVLDIVRMEWVHDPSLPYLLKTKILSQSILDSDKFLPFLLNLSRSKMLEQLQSSMSTIARSLEYLQACERNSISVEGQLERAMGWACGGSSIIGTNNSQAKVSGIPSEFHDHLIRRRQMFHVAQEQANDIMKICSSVMEFEASRDGLFWVPGEKAYGRTAADGKVWQQAYLNTLTRLDTCYHNCTCAEQEWKLAETNMEAAASGLFAVTNELCLSSIKAKSASVTFQDTLIAMRKCTVEASAAVSAFSRVSKGYTALTTECGAMLEEILAITEGLQDIYSLAKESDAVHRALMADLSEASRIILPFEASLSTDLALPEALQPDRESSTGISPAHGQALHKSYIFRLREACQSLDSLVPSLTCTVKELHVMLTRLARASSLHAGNLHKALEGLGGSQVLRSEDLAMTKSEASNRAVVFDKKENESLQSYGEKVKVNNLNDLAPPDEEWISPPEHTYTSSPDSSCSDSGSSSITSNDVSIVEKPKCHNIAADYIGLDDNIQSSSLHNGAGDDKLETSSERENGKLEGAEDSRNNNDQCSWKSANKHDTDLQETSSLEVTSRIARGKNLHAVSVLKQIELKIDGGGMEDASSTIVSEKVDHLLKQATSIDNLCNMYEGWTPWI